MRENTRAGVRLEKLGRTGQSDKPDKSVGQSDIVGRRKFLGRTFKITIICPKPLFDACFTGQYHEEYVQNRYFIRPKLSDFGNKVGPDSRTVVRSDLSD